MEQAEALAFPMAWQPNGRHLFTVLRSSIDKANSAGSCEQIRLYEKNGLVHGGFDLEKGSGTNYASSFLILTHITSNLIRVLNGLTASVTWIIMMSCESTPQVKSTQWFGAKTPSCWLSSQAPVLQL